MSDCPEDGCKKVQDVAAEVWGRPGFPNTGLKDCVKKKVPKLWLWAFICVFGLAMLTGGASVLSAVDRSQRNEKHIEELVKLVQANEIERTKIQSKVEAIYEVIVNKNRNHTRRPRPGGSDG